MKKLFIIRHGNYSEGRLNDSGKEQMEELAKAIRANLNGSSTLILTSTAPRASDSAEVMAEILNTKIEEHEEFWVDNSHWAEEDEALKIILSKKNEADALLVVTHLDFSSDLPRLYLKEELNIDEFCFSTDKGQAWEIDCKDGSLTKMPE